jgi:NTP pyrophosphatase (non-canonical NTP hydrolase)
LIDNMNDKETEIILIAQEECAEVIQAISKVNRFGIDGIHNGKSNRDHLEEEIGDLMCMFELMIEHGIIQQSLVNQAKKRKISKLKCWSNIYGVNCDTK